MTCVQNINSDTAKSGTIHFGTGANQLLKRNIKYQKLADTVFDKQAPKGVGWLGKGINKLMNKMEGINFRLWNFSLEDWSARIAVLFAFYIPQTTIAFAQDKHKWETLWRNVLNWTVTVAAIALCKSEKFGLNKVLDAAFMKQKQEVKGNPLQKLWTRMLNRTRIDYNYIDEVYEKVGIKVPLKDRSKAVWANTYNNALHRMGESYDILKAKFNPKAKTPKLTNALKKLSQTEQKHLMERIPQVMGRISGFRFLSTAAQIALITHFVGKVVMDVVFKFFAPMDHDFDPTKLKGYKGPKKQTPRIIPSRLEKAPFNTVPLGKIDPKPKADLAPEKPFELELPSSPAPKEQLVRQRPAPMPMPFYPPVMPSVYPPYPQPYFQQPWNQPGYIPVFQGWRAS